MLIKPKEPCNIPLVPEDAGWMSRLENGGARRKPDQYHMILRGFATPQTCFLNGSATRYLQVQEV
jgi:hypothetical protein